MTAKLPIHGAELPETGSRAKVAAVPDSVAASWKSALEKAHCGLATPERLVELTDLQIRRDQAMAASLIEVDRALGGGAVLLAGSAHVRRDRSVARYLPEGSSLAVAILEVTEATDAKAYLPASIGSGPVFDYVWFTPADGLEGTCQRLRKKGLIQ